MAKQGALPDAGNLARNQKSTRHGQTGPLRPPGKPATTGMLPRPSRPALGPEAQEILARMRSEPDYIPDIDDTLLILGY